MLSYYAPRWGTLEWGQPQVVKGCLSGKMVRSDIRSHCETADADGEVRFGNYGQKINNFRTYLLVSATQTTAMERRCANWKLSKLN